jgi:phosphoglycolate phosphatase
VPSAVLLDFDGTIVDPRDGLLDSFVHGLAAVGVTIDDKRTLEPLIGPPIRYGFNTFLGLTEPSLSVAVEAFRHYLGTKGVLEYQPYDGVVPLLDALVAHDVALAMVTSKPRPFVELVVDHVGLAIDFSAIVTASLDGSVAEKEQLVDLALRQLHIDADDAVMVGDREYDVIGARANGVRSIGVLWGYGSRAELEAAGADTIAETVDDLRALLLDESQLNPS